MSTRSHTLRNTLFSSVGIYTEYVLGMLTSVIIARHLGPDGFGAYSLIIWLVAMGVAATNSGTATAAIRFVAEARGGGREATIPSIVAYLRRAQRVFLAMVVVIGAGVVVFAGEHVGGGVDRRLLLVFLALGIALRASYMFNIGVAKGFENFRATAIIALVSTPINLLLVIAACWWTPRVEWLLLVFVVSGVLFYAMSLRQIAGLMPQADPQQTIEPVLLARMRRHMWLSAMTVTVGFVVASEVEVLFLTLYTGAHAAGHFKVAFQLAIGAAALVPGVFSALLLPMMANALSQGREVAGQRFAASTAYLAMLSAPLVAFGVVFALPLMLLLYGHAYEDSAPVFAFCLAGASITMLSSGGSSLLISADRQRTVLLLVVACSALKVLLDIVLIARFGLQGAMIAYFSVTVVGAIANVGLAMRVSGATLEFARLLRIALAAALAGLAVLPLRDLLVPLAAIPIGGATMMGIYALLSLLLGCWTQGDIEHLQKLHQRFARGRPAVGASLLRWAHRRAGGATS
jgi:O-antigen/teichoic acid export membrane protein